MQHEHIWTSSFFLLNCSLSVFPSQLEAMVPSQELKLKPLLWSCIPPIVFAYLITIVFGHYCLRNWPWTSSHSLYCSLVWASIASFLHHHLVLLTGLTSTPIPYKQHRDHCESSKSQLILYQFSIENPCDCSTFHSGKSKSQKWLSPLYTFQLNPN